MCAPRTGGRNRGGRTAEGRVAFGENYRIDWAGTVALLRVVGHVLHKVGAQANPDLERVVAGAWRMWNDNAREHAIFRGFIHNSPESAS